MRIFIDVGGTLLLGSNENTSALNKELIAAVKQYREMHEDVNLVVWSFYGIKTAEVVARRAFTVDYWTVMEKNFEHPLDGDIVIDDYYSMESVVEMYTQLNRFVACFNPDEFTMMVLA